MDASQYQILRQRSQLPAQDPFEAFSSLTGKEASQAIVEVCQRLVTQFDESGLQMDKFSCFGHFLIP